jgi:DNA-binding MarR family transcriptional regulator
VAPPRGPVATPVSERGRGVTVTTAGRAATRSKRAALISRIADVAPAVRKLFEIRAGTDERAAWMSLTAHQLEALTALFGGSLTMGELCERLHISESAGTALSDRLVAHEMVVREADPSDRRIVRLSLSDEAHSTVERFRAMKRARIAEVLSVLDDDELAALVRVYERLLENGWNAGRSAERKSGDDRGTR